MPRYFAKRTVKDALRTRNGPNVYDINSTPLNSPVLVYRISDSRWTKPYKLLMKDGETCTILSNDHPKEFRTTICKPYKFDGDEK